MKDSDPHSQRQSAYSLLQPPRKWTAKHVEMTQAQIIENVSPQEIVPEYIPSEDEPEFNRLAKEFCQPSREELENNHARFFSRESKFGSAFQAIARYVQLLDWSAPGEYRYVDKDYIPQILYPIIDEIDGGDKLMYLPGINVPLTIPQLSRKTKPLKDFDTITRIIAKGESYSVPLMFLSIVKADYNAETQIARNELPQCLLQAILAYSQNPNLQQYTAFAICLHQLTIRVIKATVSQTYLRNFFQRGEITEPMQLYRSEPFEILDREGRRGFLRLIMGVFRDLVEKEEAEIELPGYNTLKPTTVVKEK